MRNKLTSTLLPILVGIGVTGLALAQAPGTQSVGSSGEAGGSITKHTYITIPLEIMVNRPAAEVWKRVGKFCDIGEWLGPRPCEILPGKDGEVGAIRSVGEEILVGKTQLSYTYTQNIRPGQPYNLYHGTVEARPVTATTSKLIYTLVLDNAMLADDAAREKDKARRIARFTEALQNRRCCTRDE